MKSEKPSREEVAVGSDSNDMLGGPEPGDEPESMAAQHDRYRMALEGIRARLSITEVPQDEWVKTLHGEIFALAHYALNRNA